MSESAFAKTEGGYFMHNEEAEYNFISHRSNIQSSQHNNVFSKNK